MWRGVAIFLLIPLFIILLSHRFKFDDDRVVPVTQKEAMDDNFGGEMVSKTGAKTLKRYTNAYMLVYVRNSDIDWILEPVTEEDIPSHLRK